MAESPQRREPLAVGTKLPPVRRLISRDMILRYGPMVEHGAMLEQGRPNPIHYDREAASRAGYRDIVANGTLSLGLVSEALGRLVGEDWLRSSRISAKFIRPVICGDEISVHGELGERRIEGARTLLSFDFWCENQERDKVIVGSATISVPSPDRAGG